MKDHFADLRGKRAMALVRASSNRQENSPEQQLKLLMAFAARYGIVLVGQEILKGVTGTLPGKRADIDRLLHRKRTKNDYELVLVQDRARWTRAGVEHGASLRAEFRKVGVRIISTRAAISDADPHAWIIEGIEDQGSEAQSKRTSHDVARGLQNSMEEGIIPYTRSAPFAIDRLHLDFHRKPLFVVRNLPDGTQIRLRPNTDTEDIIDSFPPTPPLGAWAKYRKQPNEIIVLVAGDKHAVRTVRYVFRRRYLDRISFPRIALELNHKGWRSATGRTWDAGMVRYCSTNLVYTGTAFANVSSIAKFHRRKRGGVPEEVDPTSWNRLAGEDPPLIHRHRDDWFETHPEHLTTFLEPEVRQIARTKILDLMERRGTGQPYDRNRHWDSSFVLSRLLFTKAEGKALTGKRHGSLARERCYLVAGAGGGRYPKGHPIRRVITAAPVEAAAIEILSQELRREDLAAQVCDMFRAELTARDTAEEELRQLKAQKISVEKQIRVGLKALVCVSEETVNETLAPLREELSDIERRLGAITPLNLDPSERAERAARLVKRLRDLGTSLHLVPNALLHQMLTLLLRGVVDMETKSIEFEVSLPKAALLHDDPMCVVESPIHTPDNEAHRLHVAPLAIYEVQTASHGCKGSAFRVRRLAVSRDRGATSKAESAGVSSWQLVDAHWRSQLVKSERMGRAKPRAVARAGV